MGTADSNLGAQDTNLLRSRLVRIQILQETDVLLHPTVAVRDRRPRIIRRSPRLGWHRGNRRRDRLRVTADQTVMETLYRITNNQKYRKSTEAGPELSHDEHEGHEEYS